MNLHENTHRYKHTYIHIGNDLPSFATIIITIVAAAAVVVVR